MRFLKKDVWKLTKQKREKGQKRRKDRKTQKSRSEEKEVGFSSASLFHARTD